MAMRFSRWDVNNLITFNEGIVCDEIIPNLNQNWNGLLGFTIKIWSVYFLYKVSKNFSVDAKVEKIENGLISHWGFPTLEEASKAMEFYTS